MLSHPRAPNGRFTKAGAAPFGRRGAAERERRFLDRFASAKERRRRQRERARAAFEIIYHVYGPPWRPRRVPRDELLIEASVAEAYAVMAEVLGLEESASRIRALIKDARRTGSHRSRSPYPSFLSRFDTPRQRRQRRREQMRRLRFAEAVLGLVLGRPSSPKDPRPRIHGS